MVGVVDEANVDNNGVEDAAGADGIDSGGVVGVASVDLSEGGAAARPTAIGIGEGGAVSSSGRARGLGRCGRCGPWPPLAAKNTSEAGRLR